MTKKSNYLLLVAATLCCSHFLFRCSPKSTEEEKKELEAEEDMVTKDSLKMDSLKKELLNK